MLFGKYINRYYKKYAILLIIGVIALLSVDWLNLYIPEYIGKIVDLIQYPAHSVSGNPTLDIIQSALFILLFGFGVAAGRVIWRLTLLNASNRVEADLRYQMFLKAERLSVTYYHDNKVGNIMSWFTTDLETIEEYFGFGTVMLVDGIFATAFAIIKMVGVDWKLTLIALIPLLLIIVWGFFVEKFMSAKWEHRQKVYDHLYDYAQENFTGIRVIKAFVKEAHSIVTFGRVARKNTDANISFVRLSVIFDVLIEVMISVMFATILALGSWFVVANAQGNPIILFGYEINLEASTLVEFIGYIDYIIWPLIAMGQVVSMYARSKTSLGRITNYLDTPEDIKNPESAFVLKDVKGKIEYRHFSFKYPHTDVDALHDVNLVIEAGETIGVVGKIGCGKTTLVNSLLRLYNVYNGTIFIDGIDIMKANIQSVRDAIGYVPQDNFLFSDTIGNNISLADKELDYKKKKEAASFAAVSDNIDHFEKGYETVTGERGVSLSGGQKQRISIARAYAKDAPIMILDDSVSAVDLSTEETILDNIKKYRNGKTTILIASRVSTVKDLDKIIVINEGKIEAFGTHKELVKCSPTYQKMVYLQKLEKEVEAA